MFVFEPHKPWQEQTPQRFSRRIEPGRMFLPMSWSPDGTQLLGDGVPDGIFVYTLASGQFSRLLARGVSHVWLRDGRRVLVTDQRRLLVHDIAAKTTRELLSIAPDDFDSVAISADNRTIYFTRATLLGDIWLTTFK